jgi:DNA-directed RNA polymerase subunit RPC12/RpoP
MTIPAIHSWKSNAELIVDVAAMGYLEAGDRVLDCTYGWGTWWKLWRPTALVCSDINPKQETTLALDFTALADWLGFFDAIAYDPPYKLNGTDEGEGERYGVHQPASWQERHLLMKRGMLSCKRRLADGGYLLMKAQDQVSRNAVRWQTRDMADYAEDHLKLVQVDEFMMTGTGRDQPKTKRVCAACGRRVTKATVTCPRCQHRQFLDVPMPQVHAHGRPSKLMVFQKGGI